MALLDDGDLAYMRETQIEAQPTVATLLRQGTATRDSLGGKVPGVLGTGDAGRSIFTVEAWNADDDSWFGGAFVVYVPITASENVTIAQNEVAFTLDGQPPPSNVMYVNAWPVGGEPEPINKPYEPGDGITVGGSLGGDGQTLTLQAGHSYVLGLQVYGPYPNDGAYVGMVADFDGIVGRLEGTGQAITLRIDNDPNPPEPLATEFGIHLVRLTIPEGVLLSTGDTIKVSSTEQYRVVSNGDTDPWTTAQRLWGVRVVHGGA